MSKDLSIDIQISGLPNTGKTMILQQIKRVLQEAGFKVNVPVFPAVGAPDETTEALAEREANWDKVWPQFLEGRALSEINLTEHQRMRDRLSV